MFKICKRHFETENVKLKGEMLRLKSMVKRIHSGERMRLASMANAPSCQYHFFPVNGQLRNKNECVQFVKSNSDRE